MGYLEEMIQIKDGPHGRLKKPLSIIRKLSQKRVYFSVYCWSSVLLSGHEF